MTKYKVRVFSTVLETMRAVAKKLNFANRRAG